MRLRAHLNRAVQVRYLADTARPVTESNCAGAITPGGEQLEVNDQSVTTSSSEGNVNSIRSAVLASPPGIGEARNKIVLPAWREWIASGRGPQMVGDRMIGSLDVGESGNHGGGNEGVRRGQSVRSSEEASNDRGAKGRRKVELCQRQIE